MTQTLDTQPEAETEAEDDLTADTPYQKNDRSDARTNLEAATPRLPAYVMHA